MASGNVNGLMRVADEEGCWRAVQARDAAADGSFVYGVRSTGVYCRPSCPAPQPRRNQVLFYLVPEAAEQAGFRPCRRCRPADAEGGPQVQLVRRACRYIQENLESPLTLTVLGAELSVSAAYLQRLFKRVTGITPRQYADACRLGLLKARLKERRTVTMALYEAGYGSSSRLYERAAQQLGMTPATYKRGGRGMCIRYTVAFCPLGRILLATTSAASVPSAWATVTISSQGNCVRSIQRRRSAATMTPCSRGSRSCWTICTASARTSTCRWTCRRRRFSGASGRNCAKFRMAARAATATLPRALGQPTAVRAVARACATNPVAVIIPCHRVVREDGSLAGYRWGVERKESLIAQEQKSAAEADGQVDVPPGPTLP